MSAIQPINFAAVWTEQNQHLQEQSFWNSPTSEILNTLFNDSTYLLESFLKVILRPLIGRLVLVSLNFPAERSRATQAEWEARWAEGSPLQSLYEPIPLALFTPDGVLIRAVFYRNRSVEGVADIPTIVMHQPNAAIHKQGMERTFANQQQPQAPFHIVGYDYRGTGESGNSPAPLSASQLVLDGETVHQCLRTHYGISEQNIRHFGLSLGGGVSAMVRAMHPSHAPYVNCKSFTSVADVAAAFPVPEEEVRNAADRVRDVLPSWLAEPLLEIFTLDFLREIATWIIRLCRWEFDVRPSLQNIGQDALAVYDRQDEMMRDASASSVENVQKLEVVPIGECRNHHCHPLEHASSLDGKFADRAVTEFLTRQL